MLGPSLVEYGEDEEEDDVVFHFDVSNPLAVAKFPEDFNDFLLDHGRDDEGAEFLVRWKHIEQRTPAHRITLEKAIDLALEYADVVQENEDFRDDETSRSYAEAFQMLRDAELVDEPDGDDPPIPWDREAALVNQVLADSMPVVPVNLDDHEYPVTVKVPLGFPVEKIALLAALRLGSEGYTIGARDFIQDFRALIRIPFTNAKLFTLIWSYVNVVPVDEDGNVLL